MLSALLALLAAASASARPPLFGYFGPSSWDRNQTCAPSCAGEAWSGFEEVLGDWVAKPKTVPLRATAGFG
jgi:hypothetical protein